MTSVCAKRLMTVGLLAAAALLAGGCKRGPTRAPIDPGAITGTWIEVQEKGQRTARVAPQQETGFVRHLTVNADKTWTMVLHKKSGEATQDKWEGTWAIEDNILMFKVASSTVDEKSERRDLAPESSDGIRKRETGEVLSVVDLQGMAVDFKREG